MDLRFYLDPETDEPHIDGHGVTEEEVEEILANPADELPGRGDTRIGLGQTEAGRCLQVVYVPDARWRSAFGVTASDLQGRALAAFRRRRRRR